MGPIYVLVTFRGRAGGGLDRVGSVTIGKLPWATTAPPGCARADRRAAKPAGVRRRRAQPSPSETRRARPPPDDDEEEAPPLTPEEAPPLTPDPPSLAEPPPPGEEDVVMALYSCGAI